MFKEFRPLLACGGIASVLLIGCIDDDKTTGPDGANGKEYDLIELSVEGAESFSVSSISPNGRYQGGYATKRIGGVPVTVAVVWTPQGTVAEAMPHAGLSAGVNGVDNDGTAAGWTTQAADADWPSVPASFSGTVTTKLTALANPLDLGWANGIRNGILVGAAVDENEDYSQPWVRVNGVTRSLGSFGGESGYAYGVNASGKVVGWSQTGAEEWTSKGFLVQATDSLATAQRIDGLGGDITFARAVNDNGVVVGDGGDSAGKTHGFIWSQATGAVKIVSPVEGKTRIIVRSINNGNEVVGDGPNLDNLSRAWHWQEGSGKRWLDELVDGLPDGWRISVASAIANDGSIVATATDGDDEEHSILLRPKP